MNGTPEEVVLAVGLVRGLQIAGNYAENHLCEKKGRELKSKTERMALGLLKQQISLLSNDSLSTKKEVLS